MRWRNSEGEVMEGREHGPSGATPKMPVSQLASMVGLGCWCGWHPSRTGWNQVAIFSKDRISLRTGSGVAKEIGCQHRVSPHAN